MVESVYWNVGPSQTAPYGAASSPKGRAKVASLRTMSNKIPFIGTPSRPTWREANSLPYGGLSKNLPAKLQFLEETLYYDGWETAAGGNHSSFSSRSTWGMKRRATLPCPLRLT